MDPHAPIVDQYAPLAHWPIVGDPLNRTEATWLAPTWVPDTERRRLAAYLARSARLRNVGRWFLPAHISDDERKAFREYGDAALAVDRVTFGVLGDGWAVTVDGADDDLGEAPDLPPEPAPPGEDAPAALTALHAAMRARWEEQVDETITAWRARWETLPDLQARQDALRVWAGRVRLAEKLPDLIGRAVGLGDGIAVLWPQAGDWPRLEIMDPDGYFPDIDEYQDADYPDRVVFAWEYDEPDGNGGVRRWLRRITFELVPLADVSIGENDRGEPAWLVPAGGGVDADGPYRVYPWAADGERSRTTCVLSDGRWPTEDIGSDVFALDDSRAVWRTLDDGRVVNRLDLGVDFLPVVHVPGAGGDDHYGNAITDNAAQVLDDVAAADSAVQVAAAYLRDPTIALAGAQTDGIVRPGRMYGLGDSGSMDVLDMAGGHKQLVAHSDRLQDRAWQSLRVPAEMVGRVDSTEIASGVVLSLAMGPYGQTVSESRVTIAPKLALLLRMAQRMAQVQGALEAGGTPPAQVTFGSYLPTDRRETADLVARLLEAHAISRQTGLAMLVAAGFTVDDAQAELDRIRAEDTGGAKDIADATSSERLAADWLGLDLPDTGAALPGVPPVNLPGAGG